MTARCALLLLTAALVGGPTFMPSADSAPLPPMEEPLPPMEEPLPPMEEPLPPMEEPLPPMEDPLPPMEDPLPPMEDPLPPMEDPLPPMEDPLPPMEDPLPPMEDPLPPMEDPLPPMEDPPAEPTGSVPEEYVGLWQGISGSAEAKVTETVGTATVTKDFGHEIKEFEFEVALDGKITGSGRAVYWFNITCDADLIALRRKYEAHLKGGSPEVEFSISGQMSPEGRVKLASQARAEPTLINAGSESEFGAWNVFGPNEQLVKKDEDTFLINAADSFPQINLRLAFKTVKDDCATLRAQIEFLQNKYIPFIEACIAAHKKFQSDSGLWGWQRWDRVDRDADYNRLADEVLKEIKKSYPQAQVGAETTTIGKNNVKIKVFKGAEPYDFVKDWRRGHENYHATEHVPQAAVERGRLSYEEYLKWRLQNEIDAYSEVNLKKANDKLEELKKQYEATPCGPLPDPAPSRVPNS